MSSAGRSTRDYANASTQQGLFDEPDSMDGVGDENDFYRTPAWATKAILKRCPIPDSFLDPCCGDGNILSAAWDHWGRDRAFCKSFSGIELHRGRADAAMERSIMEWHSGAIMCRDALSPEPWLKAEMIAFNPPFALAEEFCRRALQERDVGVYVAALLRLSFMCGQKRRAFREEFPCDVYALAERPKFTDQQAIRTCPRCAGGGQERILGETGSIVAKCKRCNGKGTVKGGQDSADYAWFVWSPRNKRTRESRWFSIEEGSGRE